MVKQYRTANSLTMEQLAEKIGKTKSTISKWEKGTRSPKIQEIEELANFFGIDPQIMMFGKSYTTTAPNSLIEQISDKVVQLTEPNQKNVLRYSSELLDEQERATTISDKTIDLYDARKRISLPVPGKVSAGTGYWQEDDYDTMVSFYADDIPDQKDFDTIAIAVGHSMEPKIKNGDFLFIKFTPTVDLNKIGIFQVDGENYVKKLKSDCLESLNPDYDDIQFTEDMRTIGEVVDVYRER
ncbi:TPA: helix-turn-helix domain-containing protein [Streptococcus suis]|nr:helix-turn-helix domain-containing protein [Streptococcus suis]HEL1785043.1 helix-turn-helix domain-containing protein [Streptococcus suis]HEL1787877.1 helix-turn-helix domain-containing protein [Streptococcus suis]HEL1793908.1 helix-turn-helix domain-containing protein [Streptococcus suis]